MGISSSAPWLKYYDSTPAHLDYPKKTIYEMVRAAADKYPKNIAYEFMGKKTTFAEFMERIDRTAKAYLAMGIGKGDRVTICMPNCPQALDSFYALNRIGAVSNMIHPLSAASEIKFYLDFSKSKAILTLDQFYGKVAGILPELANKDTMLLVARIVDELPPVLAASPVEELSAGWLLQPVSTTVNIMNSARTRQRVLRILSFIFASSQNKICFARVGTAGIPYTGLIPLPRRSEYPLQSISEGTDKRP